MADGVPGIFNSVALINPPLTDPTCMPMSKRTALVLSMENVIGTVKAMSMPPPKPGIAPTKMPLATPMKIQRNG